MSAKIQEAAMALAIAASGIGNVPPVASDPPTYGEVDDAEKEAERILILAAKLVECIADHVGNYKRADPIQGAAAQLAGECFYFVKREAEETEGGYEDPNAEHRLGKVHYGIGG